MKTHPYLSEVSLKPSAAAYAQDFPFTLPVVRALDRLAMHPNVTFFVGENGSGKSTLLEAIAVAMGFNAEGGSRNFRFATRDIAFEPARAPARCARHPAAARRFLPARGKLLQRGDRDRTARRGAACGARIIDSFGGEQLHVKSHGEAFLALFENRFGPGAAGTSWTSRRPRCRPAGSSCSCGS